MLLGLATATLLAAACAACSGQRHATFAKVPSKPSTDPYVASLAYARCLRDHGVPHPNPDKHGDFSLTPAQEARLRSVPRKRRESAMKSCFSNLAGLNNQPLSDRAHRRAIKVLRQVKRCLHDKGIQVGDPFVQNMSLGRAMFGFRSVGTPASERNAKAQRSCEARVGLARKLTQIINQDRRTHHTDGF